MWAFKVVEVEVACQAAMGLAVRNNLEWRFQISFLIVFYSFPMLKMGL